MSTQTLVLLLVWCGAGLLTVLVCLIVWCLVMTGVYIHRLLTRGQDPQSALRRMRP